MWKRQKIQKLLRTGRVAFLLYARRFLIVRKLITSLFLLAAALICNADEQPAFRPALIGKAPDAVINRIDTKMLMAAGQKSAAVMFVAAVDKEGKVKWSGTYRGTTDSKLLEQEVQRVLNDAKMIPAVRNNQSVAVFFYGTVLFEVIEGKPRLRIFNNQEASELKSENDFVGPQPVVGGDSKFDGLHYPADGLALPVSGVVELGLKIDDQGNLLEERVVTESPPLIGFGEQAIDDFAGAKFIPAFRNGKPVSCEITLPVFYAPKN